MQEIAFEIDAQRVGRASGYLGGLTVERYTFTGATLPAGTRLAILTRAGATIAAAEITEGNAATVDTNTQEVADLLRYQPLGACESVYIALGNSDTIIALIPAVMRKNWLDDEATHPPVPANRYPTKTELDEWLARFDERAAAAETAKADAQEAAAQAAQRATAAQSAQSAAESAASVAQTAQGNAEAAQAAAGTAQEGAEAAQEAAASSATAAANSAQEAAQGVTALLQGKVDAAEAAKAGAEAAKTAAETAKAGADAANAAAASSATAAANSAEAAKQSATDLADAVATAESLDGRIAKIETGKNLGFLASGGFQAYTQLNAGDGSFKVLKDLPNMKKVALKAYDDSVKWGCFDDGNYAYVYSGQYIYGPHILFIFDSGLNAVAGPIDNDWINTSMGPSKAYYHAENERLYGVEGLYNSKLIFGCMSKDGARLKRVATSIPSNNNNGNGSGCVVYNKRSGHLVAFFIFDHYDGANQTLWYQAFDLDLNPVLNEDGSERIYSRLNEVNVNYTPIFSVKYIEDVVFLLENGGLKANGRIFTLDENDDLCVLHEGLVQADEEGNMLCETREVTNEDGTTSVEYVLDAPERNKMLRPILADGGEYHFNVAVNEEARPKLTAGAAYKTNPVFSYFNGFYFMNDGVDCCVILKNGEIVNDWSLCDNWLNGKRGKPRYKTATDRNYGFTKSGMTLFGISGKSSYDRFNYALCHDTKTGNDLSTWRWFLDSGNFWNVGNDIGKCLPSTLAKPNVHNVASPFNADWVLMGNLWYSTINLAYYNTLS